LLKNNPQNGKKGEFIANLFVYGALRLELFSIIVFYQSLKEVVNRDCGVKFTLNYDQFKGRTRRKHQKEAENTWNLADGFS
jgi:hypothetical protein